MKNEKKYFKKLGIKGIFLYWLKKYKWKNEIKVIIPETDNHIRLRVENSDIGVYEKIFIEEEYSFTFEDVNPKIIIDIGANIGASPIYFSMKYPNATVYALEPESDNFDLMVENTSDFTNIVNYNYGLWYEDKDLYIAKENLESISFALSQQDTNNSQFIKGISLDTFMQDNNIDYIDILKIDIEGAEKEIFEKKPKWLDKVKFLIIELHDRKNKGCSRAFFSAINEYTEDEHYLGDNIFIKLKN